MYNHLNFKKDRYFTLENLKGPIFILGHIYYNRYKDIDSSMILALILHDPILLYTLNHIHSNTYTAYLNHLSIPKCKQGFKSAAYLSLKFRVLRQTRQHVQIINNHRLSFCHISQL